MPQMLLPIFLPGVQNINNFVGYEVKQGKVYYFHGTMPVFSHDIDDLNSFRFITSQLVVSGNVKSIEISRAFKIAYVTVKRNVALMRKEGPGAFFRKRKGRSPHVLTEKNLKKIQRRLDKGLTVKAIANELDINPATIRKGIQNGKLKRKPKKKSLPKKTPKNKSLRNAEDSSASMGLGCSRESERVLASKGIIEKAEPCFDPASDVQSAGVLFALPALLSNGLLKQTDEYFSLPPGYYGLDTIILVLAFSALLRIQSLEQIRHCDPGEMGKLVGMDRIPEVKTLREKIQHISKHGDPGKWSRDLSMMWMDMHPELAGVLYVDGHVRPYYGRKTTLPRRYMARQRLCLRGVTDYWVNDALGQPFFVIPKTVNSGMLKVLREEIVPRLLKDVPGRLEKTEPESEEKNYGNIFSLVFDREGYSPAFIKEMWEEQVACYTYKKYVKDEWPENEFVETEVLFPNGEKEIMKIAERGLYLKKEKFWIREIRKLTNSGHQTVLITTDFLNDAGTVSGLMFSRWSQENFFKYMMKNFGIDRLIRYGTDKINESIKVVNPGYRDLDSQVRSLNSKLSRKKGEYGSLILRGEIEEKEIKDFVQKKSQIKEKIDEMEKQLSELKLKRKEEKKHIPISELPEDAKFNDLKKSEKQFMDALKMICYRAETAMVVILREIMSKKDEARAVIRQIFNTDADIEPDDDNGVLRIVLHNMTNPIHNKYVVKLCEVLNESETIFPGTNLRLIFDSVSGQIIRDQEF